MFTCYIHASRLLFRSWYLISIMVISLSRLFPAIMSSNPIIALLANEKLNGDNYVKWKSNINIVLICENQKFVLTEECPPEPHATASRSVWEKYNSWQLANNKARCYCWAWCPKSLYLYSFYVINKICIIPRLNVLYYE